VGRDRQGSDCHVAGELIADDVMVNGQPFGQLPIVG
jgi:hypothetical protein